MGIHADGIRESDDRIDEIDVPAIAFTEERIHKFICAEKESGIPAPLPLVEFDVRFFACDYARISTFYKSVAVEAEKFADEVLMPRAVQEYVDSPDRRKKYRFKKFRYTLTCVPRAAAAGIVEVTICVTVTKGGETAGTKTHVHMWDLARELIIP